MSFHRTRATLYVVARGLSLLAALLVTSTSSLELRQCVERDGCVQIELAAPDDLACRGCVDDDHAGRASDVPDEPPGSGSIEAGDCGCTDVALSIPAGLRPAARLSAPIPPILAIPVELASVDVAFQASSRRTHREATTARLLRSPRTRTEVHVA
jgi:hypothetical protein